MRTERTINTNVVLSRNKSYKHILKLKSEGNARIL